MTKVSIIIPYFQRQPGILRRAVATIYEQELPPEVSLDVLIVDDASPSPAEPEIVGFSRADISVSILKRPNGGPAKARNTGLAAAVGTDAIAFLDSDDTWAPKHIATALEALGKGAEFYFADNWYDDGKSWLGGLACRDALLASATSDAAGLYSISSAAIMPFFLEECLAHTSTVVFDAGRFGALRFDEDLATAGEDHMFWLSLASVASLVTFSAKHMASRGRGIDLYRSALDWNNPECVRRLYYALLLHKKLAERFCQTQSSRQALQQKIARIRQGIIYLLVRNGLAHARTNAWVVRQLARSDGRFWLDFPRNAFVMVKGKLAGNLDFPHG